MLKNKYNKRFFLFLLPIFMVFPAYSDEKNNTKEIVTNESQDLISEKLLDSLWNNRENIDGENQIYLFLSKENTIPKDFNIAWKIARLVYYYGNFILIDANSKIDKTKLFKYGYEAGKIAKEIEPKKVEGYYWYAINLGSYGLSKGIFSALSNAKPGRDALLEAAKIDPKYQWCGPLRILGRYYQEVPGGLISFGDKKIAEDYFTQAIQTCPEFRLNTMYLGILKKKAGDKTNALELFKKAQTLPEVDGKNEEKRYSKELAENIKSVQNM
ncbi:hypothetical protein ACWNT8_04035 [Pigmentibacter ruber]|uniref:hypothetical protein n=1 Tax=Pigmentibacter ruber TaxID=2683196 RepID=UPI00131ACEE6|nr:hypothetical protein [Pigmentibacter ruber]BFD30494.1 hypothetical protein GTC16762_01120 [Pigmentibacter ruber]